jgi:hypothetical protein
MTTALQAKSRLTRGVSMIPLVDQLCDVRDLVANCVKIKREPEDSWSWVALVLTLLRRCEVQAYLGNAPTAKVLPSSARSMETPKASSLPVLDALT